MNTTTLIAASLLSLGLLSVNVDAADFTSSTTGVNGYDLVSYHDSKRPIRGNGHFVAEHNGVTYLFANEENHETFQADPDRYLPSYGGFCAFGVSVSKKVRR